MSIYIDKERNVILATGWVPVVADNKLPIIYDTYWEAFEHAVDIAETTGGGEANAEYIEECEDWNLLKNDLSKYVDFGEII